CFDLIDGDPAPYHPAAMPVHGIGPEPESTAEADTQDRTRSTGAADTGSVAGADPPLRGPDVQGELPELLWFDDVLAEWQPSRPPEDVIPGAYSREWPVWYWI